MKKRIDALIKQNTILDEYGGRIIAIARKVEALEEDIKTIKIFHNSHCDALEALEKRVGELEHKETVKDSREKVKNGEYYTWKAPVSNPNESRSKSYTVPTSEPKEEWKTQHCSGCTDPDPLGGTHSYENIEHGPTPEPKEECICGEPHGRLDKNGICWNCGKPIPPDHTEFYGYQPTDEEREEQKKRNKELNDKVDKRISDHTEVREEIIRLLYCDKAPKMETRKENCERLADEILELIKEEHE